MAAILAGSLLLAGCGKGGTPDDITPPSGTAEADTTQDGMQQDGTQENGDDNNMTATGQEEPAGPGVEYDLPCLRDYVASADGIGEDAIIGAGITAFELSDEMLRDLVTKHFNAVTLGNELKPDCIFSYSNSKCPGLTEVEFNGQTMEMPKMNFSAAEGMLNIILDWNGEHPDKKIRVRGHVLVWHAQTPEWFFHEEFDASKPYVSKEEMTVRQEWYIKSVLEHFVGEDSKYKDLFYGWDVVNEAISDATGSYRTDEEGGNDKLSDSTHGSKSSWWHIYESNEYIINAFKFANKYAPPELELYYNDYGECSANKMVGIVELLTAVKEAEGAPGEGTRITAMGMQGHYNDSYPMREQLLIAVRTYAEVVGRVQITEFDIKASSRYDGTDETKKTEYAHMAYEYRMWYKALLKLDQEEGIDVTGITFWGVVDKYSWLQSSSNVGGGTDGSNPQCPLLFDGDYKAKPAFWVFIDPSDSTYGGWTIKWAQEAADAEASGTETSKSEEEEMADILAESYKKAGENNPLVTQRYGADPGVMVYNDTVYVYTTNDSFEYKDGKVVENTYGKIQTINCFSSRDLVNWTDHGAIPVAGDSGAATWASCSWAPCAAHKTIDGQEKFFLYFANNGSGIGVLVSDSPTGPWEDPLGKALITQGTDNCGGVVWCFDPAVLVDDDGTGYLYFGGGIPGEEFESPKTVRAVKLGDDMVSLDGTPVEIDAPYLFEDSGINKIDGKYIYSYCSNWNVQGTEYSTAAIEYMTGDSPLGPFTYAGELFKNPGVYFGVWGNNHHTIFEFRGEYYLAYHARALETAQLKENLGYRSTQIDKLTYADGAFADLKPTMKGVEQLSPLDPFETVQAETMAIQAGISVAGVGDTVVTDIETGDWLGVKGVDFGGGASSVALSLKADAEGKVEVRADAPSGELLGTVEFAATDGAFAEFTAALTGASGTKDVYFVFYGSPEFDCWRAER